MFRIGIFKDIVPNPFDIEEASDGNNNIGSGWEAILEVEATNPDLWGTRWKEHLKAEEKADTRGFLS